MPKKIIKKPKEEVKKTTKKSSKKVETEKEKKVGGFDIQKFKKQINEKFGENALMLGNEITHHALQKISTGSISLDIAIGGGVPLGRFTHISGMESTFKSTTAYHIIANAQEMNKSAMLIQSESESFTPEYGERMGIDVEDLIVNQCAGMEEALDIALEAQRCGIDLIVIDSLEGLEPLKEYQSAMDETVQMGIKPKLFGEYFRKFCNLNNRLVREGKTPCTLVGLNQLREKIGSYGDPFYSGGGNAIKFYESVEIRFRKGDVITLGTGVNRHTIGQVIKFKIHKNKVDVPLKVGEFDIYFDEGGTVEPGFVDNFKEIVLEGISYGIIEKNGSWFNYGEEFRVQGVEGCIKVLREDNELFEEIRSKLMKMAKEKDNEIEVDLE